VVADGTSQAAAMSSSLSAFPNMLSPSTSTQKMDERQLRLLGWIRCERGGSFAVGSKPLLIGVGRAQRSPHQSRWEWWALDLRHELTLGRGGELLVPRQPLLLEAVDKTDRDATPRSSLSIQRNGRRDHDVVMDAALSFSRLYPLRGLPTSQRDESALLFGFGGCLGALSVKASQP
jgi:hypothetical protein